MREIKFRARGIDGEESKSWYYGSYYNRKFLGEHYIITGNGDYYEVDPATVGQYTGLKDKNGKDIYEGDICVVIDNPIVIDNPPFEIVWGEDNSAWMWKDSETDYFDSFIARNSIVIGNIHDNPELLKEAQG